MVNNEQKCVMQLSAEYYNFVIKKNMKSAEGIEVECYRVKYLGEIYDMTKNNGKWIYFIHL